MSNAYLYVFTPDNFERKDVSDFLNTLDGIDDWFYSIPNSVFIVGTVPARSLSKHFTERFGKHRHFITLVSKKARAGWMPKEHWDALPREGET
jgi:hypothetical protein